MNKIEYHFLCSLCHKQMSFKALYNPKWEYYYSPPLCSCLEHNHDNGVWIYKCTYCNEVIDSRYNHVLDHDGSYVCDNCWSSNISPPGTICPNCGSDNITNYTCNHCNFQKKPHK